MREGRSLEGLGLLLVDAVEGLAPDEAAEVEPENDEEGGEHGIHEVVIAKEDRGQGDASRSHLSG